MQSGSTTPVRKCAHAGEYAVLGALLCLLALEQRLSVGIALAAGALYAAGDEFHQRFVPGRKLSVYGCADRQRRCPFRDPYHFAFYPSVWKKSRGKSRGNMKKTLISRENGAILPIVA